MADIDAQRAETKRATLKSFQSHEEIDMAYTKDYFDKYKHEGCWELQRNRLKFYEVDKPENNTTTTVVKIEKRRGTNILILRCGPGGRMVLFLEFDSKILTDEWEEALCQEVTGQQHSPHPALRRWKSEISEKAKQKRKRMKRARSTFPDIDEFKQVDSDPDSHSDPIGNPPEAPLEAPSEAPSGDPLEAPQEAPQDAPQGALQEAPSEAPSGDPLEAQEAPQDAPQEAPQEAPPDGPLEAPSEAPSGDPLEAQEAPQDAPQEAPQEAPPDGSQEAPLESPPDASQEAAPENPQLAEHIDDTSPLHSLRSRDDEISPTLEDMAKISVKKECSIEDLKQLKIIDYKGDVIVKEPLPQCQLHVGDIVVVTNAEGLPMNARQLTEEIRSMAEETITLTVIRGPVCVVRKEEQETVINIIESWTVKPDAVDAIIKACTSACSLVSTETPENSTLIITEINNIPSVDFSSQPDQIFSYSQKSAEIIRETLAKGHLTLRLVPQSLLDVLAEADNDVDAEQAPDVVDE